MGQRLELFGTTVVVPGLSACSYRLAVLSGRGQAKGSQVPLLDDGGLVRARKRFPDAAAGVAGHVPHLGAHRRRAERSASRG